MLRRSAAANIDYALASAGVARAEWRARTDELLKLVGLAGLGARPARRLSGGEQQRLALARALARDPEVLFLDEPTASLDPAATKAVEDVIRAVAARGIKVVMSTHDLGEARRLAGEIVLLHRGRVIECTPAGAIFRRAEDRSKPGNSSRESCCSDARTTRRKPCKPAVIFSLLAAALLLGVSGASAQDKSIVVSSTTSTQDSGLFGHILPLFKAKTGIDVKVVSQGTGQALDTGRRGDADVVFVHAKAQEEKFVAEGAGVKRHPVMYNDFVLVGPKSDPAGVKGRDIVAALQDDQGQERAVHLARRQVRHAFGRARALEGRRHRHRRRDKGPWYKEIGQGMGAALNTASASNAYVLTDRGTWLSFKNRGDLDIIVEGDNKLFNQYGVILVNPEKHKHVKKEFGQAFIDWLVSPKARRRSTTTRSTASSCSSPTPPCRARDVANSNEYSRSTTAVIARESGRSSSH